MLVADTSSLYALVDERDIHHRKARLDATRQRPFLIPSEIMAETMALISFRLGRERACQWLGALHRMPHVRIAATRQSIVDQAAVSATSGLSYPDWIVVHTCRAVGAQPWTYDDAIKRAVKA